MKKAYLPIFVVAAIFFGFASSVVAQKVEDGWKGLLPYRSTRSDVEKLLGRGKKSTDKIWQYVYDTTEATFSVNYSAGVCTDQPYPADRPGLALGMVLDYEVKLKKSVPLSMIEYDKTRFVPDEFPSKNAPIFTYRQFEKSVNSGPGNGWSVGYGIMFYGDIIDGKYYITGFSYDAPYEWHDKPEC